MGSPVHVGLKLAPQHCSIAQQRAVWRIADEAGFDHLWGFDHFNPVHSDAAGNVWEGWSLLAAMAVATARVRIGVMVTGNTYRHPGVLAKMATTVDHLSGGRLEFGLGAGSAELEHTMLGLEFPPVGERIRRLGEACEVLKRLWTLDSADYQGRHYRLEGAVANPKPVQKPHPPIWIGGSGERRTLRVVAEHADVWNFAGGTPAEGLRKSAILDGHCADAGRDPAQIRRSVQVRFDGEDVDGTVRTLEQFIEAGFSEPVINVTEPGSEAKAERAARDILSRLR